MQKVYFISGLGADRQIFSSLDLSFCQPVFVDWIHPLKSESLKEYALRLKKELPADATMIVGISFGGMLVSEMAISDNQIKGIILSSAKTSKQLPHLINLVKFIPAHRFLPSTFLRQVMIWNSWIFGAKSSQNRKLIRQVLISSDIKFVRWAIDAIINWKNQIIPQNVVHIHGSSDLLIPIRFTQPEYIIAGGTHIITLSNSQEISDLLKKLIG